MTFGCNDHHMVSLGEHDMYGDLKFETFYCYECQSKITTPIIVPDVTLDLYRRRLMYTENTQYCTTNRWNDKTHGWEVIPSADKNLIHSIMVDVIKAWNKANPSLPL